MRPCVLPQAGGCIGSRDGRRHLFALPGWSTPFSLGHPQLKHARLQANILCQGLPVTNTWSPVRLKAMAKV